MNIINVLKTFVGRVATVLKKIGKWLVIAAALTGSALAVIWANSKRNERKAKRVEEARSDTALYQKNKEEYKEREEALTERDEELTASLRNGERQITAEKTRAKELSNEQIVSGFNRLYGDRADK